MLHDWGCLQSIEHVVPRFRLRNNFLSWLKVGHHQFKNVISEEPQNKTKISNNGKLSIQDSTSRVVVWTTGKSFLVVGYKTHCKRRYYYNTGKGNLLYKAKLLENIVMIRAEAAKKRKYVPRAFSKTPPARQRQDNYKKLSTLKGKQWTV